jgi:hypothetical protein
MTGPEHYREAAAQAHATLALAAATAAGALNAIGQAIFSPGQFGASAPKRDVADRFTAADLGEIEPT